MTAVVGTERDSHRVDVQALRACAVLAVVGFHVGLPVIDGGFVGVDIFFVISGFLITRLLVAERDRTGRISFPAFYARRIRRLLPMAMLVLVVTLAVVALTYSPFDLSSVATDAGFTAAYLANFRFAFSGQDYFAITPSPLVHYWSLAVEEQFYVVWPFLLALLLARRRWPVSTAKSRLWLRSGIAALLVLTFVHSLVESTAHPAFAYYSSSTRAWQLLAGALVAVTVPHGLTRASAGVRTGATLAGFAVLLGSVVLINETMTYPGLVAAAPVVGAVIILVAAPGSQGWLSWLMGLYPLVLLGELSYGWYLWHWPAIILGERIIGPGGEVRVAMGVFSLVLAFVTYHLVENPLRRGRLLRLPRRAGLAAGLAATLAVVASVGVYAYNQHRLAQPRYVALDAALHAESPADSDCFSPDVSHLLSECSAGPTDGPRLVLAGDSNARMWYPALSELGKTMGFQTVLYSGNGCNVLGFPSEVLEKDCQTYSRGLASTFKALDPDAVVFTHAAGDKRAAIGRAWLPRLKRFVQAREQAGASVGSIDNVPAARFDIEKCLLGHLSDYAACNVPEKAALRGPHRWTAFQAGVLEPLDVATFDPSTVMCARDVCPIESPDGKITLRDGSHITEQYSAEIAPDLENFVRQLLPDLPKTSG